MVMIRHWTKMAEEEGEGGGRASDGKAEEEDDVMGRLRAGCGSEPVRGRAKKEDEVNATINLRATPVRRQRCVLVRVIEHLADVGERQPGQPPVRVTTLGSCSGRGGAQRKSQRRDDDVQGAAAMVSRVLGAVHVSVGASWRIFWREATAAERGASRVQPFNFKS